MWYVFLFRKQRCLKDFKVMYLVPFFFFLDEAIYFTVHRLIRLSFPAKMYSDTEKWLV